MSRLRLKNQRGRLYLQSPSHGAHCPLNFERLEGRRLLSVNGGDSQIAVDPDFNDGVGNVVEANPSTNSGGPIANFSAQAQASELPKHPAVFTAFLPAEVSLEEFSENFRPELITDSRLAGFFENFENFEFSGIPAIPEVSVQ